MGLNYGNVRNILSYKSFSFIRDQVENKVVTLMYCPTEIMLANMLTKGLGRERFCKLRELIGMKKNVKE